MDQKRAMLQQARAVVGKPLSGHEDEFGDGPSDSAPQEERIPMADGSYLPAKDVRAALEKEMGAALVGKAVEFVSDILSNPNGLSNLEIQRELNTIVGAKFAHHSNAIAKLAVWEGKQH